ncbi:MAG: DUF2064 domain-containing protein [Gemmatimonadaceae bacterium]
MHATESNEDTAEQPHLQTISHHNSAQRRAVEMIELSNRAAGARVTEVVRHRLADGSERVVITNADREVSRDLVDHAFEALRYSALVCAPDVDGSIALLGVTAPLDALFSAISWGASNALDQLLSTARAQHVSVLLLPPTGIERIVGG